MFIDPETKLVASFTYLDIQNNKDLGSYLSKNINHGERYMLKFLPKQNDDSAHLVSIYKDNSGNIVFNDVMTGKVYGSEFMNTFSYKYGKSKFYPAIMRTDDKLLNIQRLNKVSKPSSKN